MDEVQDAPAERRVRFDGGSLTASVWGPSGADVVLCWHGAGGSAADYALIGPTVAVELGAQVVAIDAPGHAHSSIAEAEKFRPSALAALAARVLDESGAAQATFVGFSWGASIGCWFAALFPHRARALVLVEGGHLDFADVPGFRPDRGLGEFVADARKIAELEGPDFGSHSPEVAGAMVWGLAAEPASDTYSRLAEAQVPVLFVGTRGDDPTTSNAVARLRRLVPQISTVEIAAPGHELLREAPSAVAQAIASWVRGIDS